MIIKNITIRNFKSLYGEHFFDFEKMNGLVKLSGTIGAGKTSIAEAILFGLFGSVKGQNNPHLISWNTKACEVELNIRSKDKDVHIIRNIREPLVIEINGKTLAGTNKLNTQEILEEEIFDVPKLAIIKMCIISFNAFNSLANMNPSETKQFLDDIFGFKLFTNYNDEIVVERKNQQNESTKLNALYEDNLKQIDYLKAKKDVQKKEIKNSIDIDALNKQRQMFVDNGVNLKKEQHKKQTEMNNKLNEYIRKMTEVATLGKQEREWINKFKTGFCPTCGNAIDKDVIQNHQNELNNYLSKYKEFELEKNNVSSEYKPIIESYDIQMNDLKSKISEIDSKIKVYKNSLSLVDENYDDLISEYENKAIEIKTQLDKVDIEIGEWNEMNELFTKTLRYNLLDTLIPHINNSIKYFISKLEQTYKVEYDQEFKAHIYVDTFEREISYNNLSTGQKKSLDMAIIFGILQNIISNVNFNILFLDELFSNMDSDTRNIMLSLLKETMGEDKTIFVVNHAEMNDDYFDHKIRVSLKDKKINTKKDGDIIVKCSKYEAIF